MANYDIIRSGEDVILRLDYSGEPLVPSIEDNPRCMSDTIKVLTETRDITKIVFFQKRDYEYDYDQAKMLLEISEVYNKIIKENMITVTSLTVPGCNRCANAWYVRLRGIVFRDLTRDPLGAYMELKRFMREEEEDMQHRVDPRCVGCVKKLLSLVSYLLGLLEGTVLLKKAMPSLPGFKPGDRELYRELFTAVIKPDFMFSKLMATYPPDAEELDSYTIEDSEVTVLSIPGQVQYLYHIVPPEYKLNEDRYELLDIARSVMAEHKPQKEEFVDPERMREVFYNVGSDLIEELAAHQNLRLRASEIKTLTEILVRYTVGFGMVEVLLSDEKVQDISINAPMGNIPIYIVHQDFDDCRTNILPAESDGESWSSKLRMISGRPLDEANPLLDTEIDLPQATSRVSVITRPLCPFGTAFSFRRHRDKPWTLPLFMKVNMISKLCAGLLSFLVDGTRTMLICGTRSSGKTSFLTGILIEIMRRYRIITIEDTLELPTTPMRKLGYNIQPMKVASALGGGSDVNASDGIRATLRLGDSALIVGEVRSKEAISLYEAMRIGAQANVVAGTIHANSPYGVYDRVVNDIGVPKTSFKATDVCIIANPIKSADGMHKYRRVTQITEVRKDWEDDPMTQGGFMDLMKYNAQTDTVEPTGDLINGESQILKDIAGNVKDFAGNWDAVWQNVVLRGDIKQAQLDMALKLKNDDMLEAPFTLECNDMFHRLCEQAKEEVGAMDPKHILFEFNQWLNRRAKKLMIT